MASEIGRSPSGRATRASTEPASGFGHSAGIPSADYIVHCFKVVGEMLEYFDSYTLATWSPLASIIDREITREREACAALARKLGHRELGDMIEGAAIECSAIAQAIEARRAETGTGSVHESAVRQDAPNTPGEDN